MLAFSANGRDVILLSNEIKKCSPLSGEHFF